MIQLRKSNERGHANHGWLDSFHTFSFADYYDPEHMQFGELRVINEDRIAGGGGFPTHPHRDMEIVTYVIDGALEHKDTLGNSTVIRPGEVQRMSAGTGIRHSEFNHYKDRTCHLLQIWIMTEKEGIPPGYEQKDFSESFSTNEVTLVASRDGADGSVTIHQDAKIFVVKAQSDSIQIPVAQNRRAWIQMVKGKGSVNGTDLQAGDGLAAENEENLQFVPKEPSEFLVFDLP